MRQPFFFERDFRLNRLFGWGFFRYDFLSDLLEFVEFERVFLASRFFERCARLFQRCSFLFRNGSGGSP